MHGVLQRPIVPQCYSLYGESTLQPSSLNPSGPAAKCVALVVLGSAEAGRSEHEELVQAVHAFLVEVRRSLTL